MATIYVVFVVCGGLGEVCGGEVAPGPVAFLNGPWRQNLADPTFGSHF